MTETTGRKQAGRRWKPGESGNPKGRPRGSGIAGDVRKAIAGRANDILAAMISKALEGDVQAGRALLDRIAPSLKPESLPVALAGIGSGTPWERAHAAMAAAGRGEVPVEAAAALVAAAGGIGRLWETEELERRIAALEKNHGK